MKDFKKLFKEWNTVEVCNSLMGDRCDKCDNPPACAKCFADWLDANQDHIDLNAMAEAMGGKLERNYMRDPQDEGGLESWGIVLTRGENEHVYIGLLNNDQFYVNVQSKQGSSYDIGFDIKEMELISLVAQYVVKFGAEFLKECHDAEFAQDEEAT